jgi:hypothetical protein
VIIQFLPSYQVDMALSLRFAIDFVKLKRCAKNLSAVKKVNGDGRLEEDRPLRAVKQGKFVDPPAAYPRLDLPLVT